MIATIKSTIYTIAMTTLMVFVLLSCTPQKKYISISGNALGTNVQVKCQTDVSSEKLIEVIRNVDSDAKASMSIFNPESLLSKINRGETDSLDSHISHLIGVSRELYDMSDGAYDITVKPLTDAWGFGRDERNATPNIDSLLQFIGLDKIEICNGHLVRSDYRTQIDLNSIAKGYTVDLLAQRLEELEIDNYMVNIGGEIRCRGVNASGHNWSIGIETPYDGNVAMDSIEKIIKVSDCAMATSGNYRRFYRTESGDKVVHTIDPRTGYCVVSDLLSVTVIAPTCTEADAAATMFMAMGSTGGALELAKRCEQERGWKYYFIYASCCGYRVECSEELK